MLVTSLQTAEIQVNVYSPDVFVQSSALGTCLQKLSKAYRSALYTLTAQHISESCSVSTCQILFSHHTETCNYPDLSASGTTCALSETVPH